jgi:hypothetical protein
VLYPDSFNNTTLYQFRSHYYAIHDDVWYRLWGWAEGGGREATAVTEPVLIEQLDQHAVEVSGHKL